MPEARIHRPADGRRIALAMAVALSVAAALLLPGAVGAAEASTTATARAQLRVPAKLPATKAVKRAKKTKKIKRLAKRHALKRAAKVLDRVNEVRAHGRTCGSTYYRAARPLRADARLAKAARRHAKDMARHNYFSHNGRSGSTPTSRAKHAGYNGGAGENIAAGYGSPAKTMRAWLRSPGHCANIMGHSYRSIGVGYANVASSSYGDYWVQDFGLR
jgi:uncharacterized protein YkwD